MKNNIRYPLSRPNIGEAEQNAVQRVMASGWLGPNGPEVNAFESEFKAYLNNEAEVLALSSGTAALHLALKVLGIGAGDVVLVQSFSFCAPAFAINYVGAEAVFIDSELETWNMDPFFLEQALEYYREKGILDKVKAIIPVYAYGNPPNMRRIQTIANEYKIPLVVDAAEAIGSAYGGKQAERIGDLVILSFNANKTLSTCGGGALISANKEYISKARQLANQAKETGYDYYQHKDIGYNYAMNSIAAAIGRAQLKRLDSFVDARRSLFDGYKENLEAYGITDQIELNGAYSNRWLSAFIANNLNRRTLLIRNNPAWEIRPAFKPIHLQKPFLNNLFFGSGVAEQVFKAGIVLPSGAGVELCDISNLNLD